MFEGRRHATQFEIGDDGWPSRYEIEEPKKIDERRRAVGLARHDLWWFNSILPNQLQYLRSPSFR